MRTYLINPETKQFKANMHGHSECSDGKLTLAEIKAGYRERGYNVYAFSDHRVVRDHRDLAEDDFLPLAAAELDISEPGEECFNLRKSFHFNIIARDRDNFEQVDCTKYPFGIDGINKIIAEAKEKNYIVVANHPNWSLFTEKEFDSIEGLDGFEIYNTITENYGGAIAFTPEIYLHLLRNGKDIMAIGADDCHSFCLPFSNPQNDSFGGFTYILADKLNYDSIIKALDEHKTYASCGPRIFEAYIEDGKLNVKTSDCVRITMITENRYTRCINARAGETITEAAIEMDKERVGRFILLDVIDERGKHAITSPFYLGTDFD